MTSPVANCPSCGGPVRFRWSQAVQTVCEYCSSILVRHDVDLEAVGKVSAPPPVTSRVQLGTEGRYRDRPFTVVGRIAYAYQRGGWSEWHVVFGDGSSGWLSDAQAEYAVTFLARDTGTLPRADEVQVGRRFGRGGVTYEAVTLTRARYAGVEGELPFEYWDHDEVLFVDLRSPDGRLATLDYSDPEPLLFEGETVPLDELRLTGLRDAEERRAGEVRTLNCSHCGGPVEVRAPGQTVSVVCRSCGSILDARSPGVKVLQQAKAAKKSKVKALIPLGTEGQLRGAEYQVLGFQVRAIRVEGVYYSWGEYLLYNAEQGFRYLTEYQGHWNDVLPLKSAPQIREGRGHPTATLHGETFRHFQTATAKTTHVRGEFPWEVRVGDKATVSDYVAPPRMLSSEVTDTEKTWSLGEYVTGARVWEAFRLPGAPPAARGTYANQPSPHGLVARGAWKAFALLFALFVALAIGRMVLAPSERVLTAAYGHDPLQPDSSVFVTEPFTLEGRPTSVEVELDTDLSNNWAYFNFSLLNLDTRTAIDFGREVSYYYGVDGGESWSEGDRDDSVLVPSVPAGRYVLRVAPEGPALVQYTVRVRRDVPNLLFYGLAFLLLVAPPLFFSLRAIGFEKARWAESDHAPEEDDE